MWKLPRREIRFDHKHEVETFILSKINKTLEKLFPFRVPGEIVVRDKEEWILLAPRSFPYMLDNRHGVTKTHRVPLYSD